MSQHSGLKKRVPYQELPIDFKVHKQAHDKERIKLGSELAALGRRFGGIDLPNVRDASPSEPAEFE